MNIEAIKIGKENHTKNNLFSIAIPLGKIILFKPLSR